MPRDVPPPEKYEEAPPHIHGRKLNAAVRQARKKVDDHRVLEVLSQTHMHAPRTNERKQASFRPIPFTLVQWSRPSETEPAVPTNYFRVLLRTPAELVNHKEWVSSHMTRDPHTTFVLCKARAYDRRHPMPGRTCQTVGEFYRVIGYDPTRSAYVLDGVVLHPAVPWRDQKMTEDCLRKFVIKASNKAISEAVRNAPQRSN